MSPEELAGRLGAGLLAFPVTHFSASLGFDEGAFREHVEWLLGFGPAGLFAAGGAGEFFSLTFAEFSTVVGAAVEQTAHRVPVIAGCGYGTAMAKEFAQAAEEAGADGLLLMPPYLVNAEAAGLAPHVEAVCRATKLGVIFYNRDNAVLDEESLGRLCERAPNLVGFKDGVGDREAMRGICTRFRGRLALICGMPTAETFALEYFAMGADTYSSAIFNFLPEFALEFHGAARRGDTAAVRRMEQAFVEPYVAIRSRRKGYAVSIVKAGMKVVGRGAGPVRPPMTDLDAGELEALAGLVAKVRALR
jgi:5-dehydro-4-deoxyglucarate dehydratase